MNSNICEAIKLKRKIQFYYEGGTRTVEPYCYGINAKGNEVLRAYQTSGYSQSGNPGGWRLFITAKINSLILLNDGFDGNRSEYNPYEKQMTRIYCNVK